MHRVPYECVHPRVCGCPRPSLLTAAVAVAAAEGNDSNLPAPWRAARRQGKQKNQKRNGKESRRLKGPELAAALLLLLLLPASRRWETKSERGGECDFFWLWRAAQCK